MRAHGELQSAQHATPFLAALLTRAPLIIASLASGPKESIEGQFVSLLIDVLISGSLDSALGDGTPVLVPLKLHGHWSLVLLRLVVS